MSGRALIPRREAEFLGWSNHYTNTIVEAADHYFLTDEEIAALQSLQADFDEKYAAHVSASDHARAATQAKREARDELEETIRKTARRIMADERVSDYERKEAGLPVHKSTRTPVRVPTTSPVGQVVASDRLEHRVLVTDSGSPTKRRKPQGVIGCEAFLLVRDMPSFDPEDYSLIGIWTRYPEAVEFESEDGGKTAHYLLRWINTRRRTRPLG